MVVDENYLAAGSGDADGLGDGFPPDFLGLLMEQEEHHGLVETVGRQRQGTGILMVVMHVFVLGELFASVLQLDRRHVDEVELRAVTGQMAGQQAGEFSVNAGDLEHPAVRRKIHFVQHRAGQLAHVAPQDQVDHPLALEEMQRFRVQVRPPVGVLEVLGDRGWGLHGGQARLRGRVVTHLVIVAIRYCSRLFAHARDFRFSWFKSGTNKTPS